MRVKSLSVSNSMSDLFKTRCEACLFILGVDVCAPQVTCYMSHDFMGMTVGELSGTHCHQTASGSLWPLVLCPVRA